MRAADPGILLTDEWGRRIRDLEIRRDPVDAFIGMPSCVMYRPPGRKHVAERGSHSRLPVERTTPVVRRAMIDVYSAIACDGKSEKVARSVPYEVSEVGTQLRRVSLSDYEESEFDEQEVLWFSRMGRGE